MQNIEQRHSAVSSDGLPSAGFIRLNGVIGPRGPIPVSRSTWWAGVRSGRFPKPVKIGPRSSAWEVNAIRKLVASIANSQCDSDEALKRSPVDRATPIARCDD
jgi:prophage regulatory protein